ncbi:MAG: propionyl-CoA synthetase [Myxococcota bacterium]
MSSLREVHRASLEDPETFWAEAARELDWVRPWDGVLDERRAPFYRWFQGGLINTCHNALDRHVASGHGDQPALIYDSPITGTKQTFTYAALTDRVSRFAGALAKRGVGKGDRVIIYMPMVPEAVVGMLACARLGAIHSVVFGGFAAAELAKRIDDARPKLILSASCGIEPSRVIPYAPLLREALALAQHEVERCVILQRQQAPAELAAGEESWAEVEAGGEPVPCTPVDATDPLYILYTSGTTGEPKGIVRDNGGHAVALNWTMKNVYGVEPGDTYWAASDVGWVVGHSYIVYGPLLNRCTTILYEGKPVGTPDAGAFWRVVEELNVRVLFTAPTAIRAIKQQDPEGEHARKHDTRGLRALFLAGERCDPATLEWAQGVLKVPVIDHWWQTETGWAVASNCLGIERLPVKPGSPTRPVPGWDVRVLDDEGQPASPGTIGNIVARLPLPPGALPTLWSAENRYREAYLDEFPGYYKTADAGMIDEDGYVFVMSRTDDVINVAGHRLSTGAMEEVLAGHSAVAECAVVGVSDELKGQRPMAFVVLKSGAPESAVADETKTMVRDKIGPIASLKSVHVVERLPKTRSGKILRKTLRSIMDGQEWKTPPTIEDATVLDDFVKLTKT